jgi:phage terminase large subunit-like protein
MATSQPADPTTAYCRDVIKGKIVAGQSAIASCNRHLADLKDGPKRGLVWKPDLAAKAIAFFPAVLTITGGSHAGQPFTLLPWQVFVVGSLYGWLKPDGTRRFRSA